MRAIGITLAAKELDVSPPTLRRWIQQGAPTVELGSAGRGRGSIVDVDAIRLWRARRHGVDAGAHDLLPQVTEALLDVMRRDGGDGKPAHVRLGIPRDAAAELLLSAYGRIARVVKGP